MMTELKIVGPIKIPYDRQTRGLAKRITKEHARVFWTRPEAKTIARKQGCYVFALQASKGFSPWYVGRTTKAMNKECFTYHKLQHYNNILFRGHRAKPVMFFVIPRGTKNKISAKVAADVEKQLIQAAVYKNPSLANIQNTKNLPNWRIDGIVRSGQGKANKASRSFRKMMKL